MAFAHELEMAYGDRVTIHADDERGGRPDLDAFLGSGRAEVYVCGPEPLLASLIQKVPADRLHYERFAAVARASDEPQGPYEVTLARTGRSFTVAPGEKLLDAVNRNGGALVSSCGEGVCGTCEVRVLRGTPRHLDSVTSDEDKDEIGVMYPCVSGSATPTLVLDV
jgi:ferredoxin